MLDTWEKTFACKTGGDSGYGPPFLLFFFPPKNDLSGFISSE